MDGYDELDDLLEAAEPDYPCSRFYKRGDDGRYHLDEELPRPMSRDEVLAWLELKMLTSRPDATVADVIEP